MFVNNAILVSRKLPLFNHCRCVHYLTKRKVDRRRYLVGAQLLEWLLFAGAFQTEAQIQKWILALEKTIFYDRRRGKMVYYLHHAFLLPLILGRMDERMRCNFALFMQLDDWARRYKLQVRKFLRLISLDGLLKNEFWIWNALMTVFKGNANKMARVKEFTIDQLKKAYVALPVIKYLEFQVGELKAWFESNGMILWTSKDDIKDVVNMLKMAPPVLDAMGQTRSSRNAIRNDNIMRQRRLARVAVLLIKLLFHKEYIVRVYNFHNIFWICVATNLTNLVLCTSSKVFRNDWQALLAAMNERGPLIPERKLDSRIEDPVGLFNVYFEGSMTVERFMEKVLKPNPEGIFDMYERILFGRWKGYFEDRNVSTEGLED